VTINSLSLLAKCLLLGFFLGACAKNDPHPADDYLKRLHSALGVATFEQFTQALPDYPSPRDLKIHTSADYLNIREFISMRECKLHSVIAERNSLIGKVAPASQRLFNDLAMLSVGPDCVDTLEQNNQSALADKLREFLAFKRARIGQSLWQALLGEGENAQFWSATNTVSHYPKNLTKESRPSIVAITRFAHEVQNGRFDYTKKQTDEIEKHLGILRFGDGGQLLREYATLVTAIERSNRAVQRRLLEPLCLLGKPTTNAYNLQNVVNNFFVARLQAHAVALNRRYEQLIPSYLALESMLSGYATEGYASWASKRQKLMQQGLAATTMHSRYLQKLYRQCGLKPGKPADARRSDQTLVSSNQLHPKLH